MKKIFTVIGLVVVSFWALQGKFQSKSSSTKTYTFQVLVKQGISSGPQKLQMQHDVVQVERFDQYPSPFFSRLYDVTVTSESAVQIIESLPFVEGIHRPIKAQLMAVYPPKQGNFINNDTFFNHQWAFENIYAPGDESVDQPELARGHLLRKDLSDVQVKFLSSRPADGSNKTYDLNFTEEVRQLALSNEGRDIIVAVIDSGIDWNHPDLKNSIFRKDQECQNGNIPRPVKDFDNNGYKNDCMGWNFTAAKTSPARNRPFDTLGHGTHLAGILAAATNNNSGMAGVSTRIKIMPLKVVGYGSDIVESQEFEPDEFDGFTSQVAKAIRYATHEGAEVINLSLGWPRVANIDIVREAIKEALEKNVTVVAASGNNGHTSKIMPCSMQGVICVGAINNDGTVTDYSNYGGHVDVLAPGHAILSTWPLQMTPDTFDVDGYEILNGTSQATPYVAGLVALMKLKNKDITSSEIRGRLISTSRPVYKELDVTRVLGEISYNSIGGTVQYSAALSDSWNQVVLAPNLKGSPLIKYQPESLTTAFTIPVEALGGQAKNVEVQLISQRTDIKLAKSIFTFESIQQGQIKNIQVNATLENAFVDSEWSFDIVLTSDSSRTLNVRHNVYLARDLETDSTVVKISKPVLDDSSFGFRPVVDIRRTLSNPSIFTSRLDEKGIFLNIHTVTDEATLAKSPDLFIPNLHQRPNGLGGPQFQLFAEDFNEDGKPDYLIVGIYADESGDYVQLSYFRHDFQPLYGNNSHWPMKLEHAAPNFKDLKFMEMDLKGLGKVKVPIFITEGAFPELDKAPKMEFQKEDGISTGIYVLEPYWSKGSVLTRARRIDSYKYKSVLRRKLGIRDVDRLNIVGLLTQSQKDFLNSKITVLYGYGHQNKNLYALVSLNESSLRRRTTGVSKFSTRRRLTNNALLPVMDLSGPHPKNNIGTAFVDIYQFTRFRSVFVDHNDNWKIQQDLRYQSSERSELILGGVRGFTKNDVATIFLETGYKTIALVGSKNSDTKIYKRKINRSTFLPGYFFSEIMQPTAILTPEGHEPALYVDATAILSGNIILWQVGADGAKAPAKFNLQIPSQCRTIEKMYWKAKRADTVILDCEEEDSSYLLLYPLIQ